MKQNRSAPLRLRPLLAAVLFTSLAAAATAGDVYMPPPPESICSAQAIHVIL